MSPAMSSRSTVVDLRLFRISVVPTKPAADEWYLFCPLMCESLPATLQLYQAGVRVPFFINGPGFKNEAGDSTGRLVANVDLARSLFDIATGDDDYPFFTDGISFLPILKGKSVSIPTCRPPYHVSAVSMAQQLPKKCNGIRLVASASCCSLI